MVIVDAPGAADLTPKDEHQQNCHKIYLLTLLHLQRILDALRLLQMILGSFPAS